MGGANVNATTHTGTTVSVSANVTGGNVLTGGLVSATATITGGNLATGGTASATGNITGGNVLTGGLISATSTITSAATITGGNLATGGTASASGNITGGNVLTAGVISATGNVSGGNINTNNLVSASTLNIVAGTINLNPTGNVGVNSRWINNLADPTQDQDAATKYYVDTVAKGLHVHQAANLASTQDLATYTGATVTYNNGTSGVGATLSLVGNTLTTLDGTAIPAAVSTRLLIKNQANAVLNGVYNYSSSSLLTRSVGEDTNGELNGGDFLFVLSGSTQADTGWVQTTDNVVVGTTNVVFTQFTGAGTYSAGNGISITGTVINTIYDNSTIGLNGSNQLIVKASASLTTPNIGAATGTSLSTTGTITGGNLAAGSGTISTSGNVTGGNILTGGLISATGNVAGNYFIGNGSALTGLIASVSNISSGTSNVNVVSSGGNVTVGVGGTGNVVVFATTGEYVTGLISANGNITGGNVLTGGLISATATVTGGNLATGGTASATGNITGGNVLTGGLVSATGNVAGNYFIGNGSQLTGISTSGGVTKIVAGTNITISPTNGLGDVTINSTSGGSSNISNGTSNVSVYSSGNVAVGINGSSNVGVFSSGSLFINGLFTSPKTITGNVLMAPNSSSMVISPLLVADGYGITVPSDSTLYVWVPS